jgi:hypothetical protein
MPLKHNAYFQQCYHLAGPAVALTDLSVSPRRLANQFCIVQRDDGMFSIGWHDNAAGPFETRAFAESVATRTTWVLA